MELDEHLQPIPSLDDDFYLPTPFNEQRYQPSDNSKFFNQENVPQPREHDTFPSDDNIFNKDSDKPSPPPYDQIISPDDLVDPPTTPEDHNFFNIPDTEQLPEDYDLDTDDTIVDDDEEPKAPPKDETDIKKFMDINNNMPTVEIYWLQSFWASFADHFHRIQKEYDKLKEILGDDNYLKQIYDSSYSAFLSSLTSETLLDNPMTNFIVSRVQPILKYPETVYLKQLITIVCILFAAAMPLIILILIIIVTGIYNIAIAKVLLIALTIRLLLYYAFAPKRMSSASPTVIIQHQSSYSFYVLTTIVATTILWLLRNEHLSSVYLWAGITLTMTIMVIVHQFSIKEKSVSLPIIAYVIIVAALLSITLAWEDTTLPVIISYFTHINLANRKVAVEAKMENNYFEERAKNSISFYGNVATYGPQYAADPSIKFVQLTTLNRPAQMTFKDVSYFHCWNVANQTNVVFFRYAIPLLVITFLQWMNLHETIGVQKVISSKLNENKHEAKPPDKISYFYEVMSYHSVPTGAVVVFMTSLALQSLIKGQYDYIAILLLLYIIAIYVSSIIFEAFSVSAWISLADSMKAGAGQIVKDYFMGNITSNLGSEHLKNGILTGTIIILIINGWALNTLEYSNTMILLLSSLPMITVYKLHQFINSPHEQMMYLISLMLALTSYTSALLIYLIYICSGKCMHFFTFQIRNRHQTMGQPSHLQE